MVEQAAWYNRVETVRPIGKGVLACSALLLAKFLHTANWVRVHKPLNHARVVWMQFGATVSTGAVGLFLAGKPCWEDPKYLEEQKAEALGKLGKIDWTTFHSKWGARLKQLGIESDVEKWLASEVSNVELSFFDFIAKHGVQGLGAQADALKAKFNPAEAKYEQIDRARAEMAQLGIDVDTVLKQRWQAGVPADEVPFFTSHVNAKNLAELVAQYPKAHEMGLPDELIGRLLAKQMTQDGWSKCMSAYARFYDESRPDIADRVRVTMDLEVTLLSASEFWKKHGTVQFKPEELSRRLMQQAKTLSWDGLEELKPFATALGLAWSEVLASRWFESTTMSEPEQVRAALEADALDREKFQAWLEQITTSMDDVLQYEWAAPYLQQSDEMTKRVAQYYWDQDSNSLATGKFQHLIPNELEKILADHAALTEYLTRSQLDVSMLEIGQD